MFAKLGAMGDYTAGVVAAAACIVALMVILVLLPFELMLDASTVTWFGCGIAATALIGTYTWRRTHRAPS